jgi:hypothetical protein
LYINVDVYKQHTHCSVVADFTVVFTIVFNVVHTVVFTVNYSKNAILKGKAIIYYYSPQYTVVFLWTVLRCRIYCSVFADCSIEKYSHFYNLKSVVFFADCIVFAYITVVFTRVLYSIRQHSIVASTHN